MLRFYRLAARASHRSTTCPSSSPTICTSQTISLKDFHDSSFGSQPFRLIHVVQRRDLSQAQGVDGSQAKLVTNWDQNLSMPPYVDGRMSYAYGRSNKELMYCTVGELLERVTLKEPHSTSVVVYDEGISKSFEQLSSDVNKLVNGMVNKLNLKRGLTLNTINPSYKAHEFSYVLGKSDVKVIFMPGKNSKQSSLNDHWSVICDDSIRSLQEDGSIADLKNIVILDGEFEPSEMAAKNIIFHRWQQVLSTRDVLDQAAVDIIDSVRSDDIYGVYYTSGTTGFPKGATVTQFNVINNALLSCSRLFEQRGPEFKPIRPNICLPLPLFHEFAGVLGILSILNGGGSIVFPGKRYCIKTVVESILRFKCNAIFLTPTILIDLLSHIERNELKDFPIRSILIAGSPVVSELVNKTQKALPNLEEMRIGYGSSENGVIATIQTSQEPKENKPYTVGPPLDFTEIRIADTKTGLTKRLGESGEVQTRGFNTMLCYYNEPQKTNDVITEARWYRTGDLGIIDKHGSLQIVGRFKDLIIKGGENIYPAEVETVLHSNKLIEDAHVFGVPDKRFGEEVCVWIKLDKDKCRSRSEDELREEIREFCKQRLTYFKVPKYVLFVEEFPVTPVKKIKKFEMRAQTIKLLNLEGQR